MQPSWGLSLVSPAVPGGKSRKRSAASMAEWEDEDALHHDPVQQETLDLTEDDLALSMVHWLLLGALH